MSYSKEAPSKFLFFNDFNKWKTMLQNFIAYKDPELLILITEQRYNKPIFNRNMTFDEQKRYNNDKRAYEMITKCLPQDVIRCYSNQATAYDLWDALCISSDEQDQSNLSTSDEGIEEKLIKKDEPQTSTFITSKNEVVSKPSFCASCIKLTDNINRYREKNECLKSDLENLMEANNMLKENEKVYEQKLKAIFEEKKEYKAKIFEQQDEIDSYLKMMTIIKKELADSQAEVLDLKRKLSNFSTSSLVFDEILQSQRTDTKSKAGLGYHHVPPPKDYLPMPSKDPIKDFVPSSYKVATNSVNSSVNEPMKKAELVRPTFVKAESKPLVCVEEIVEVEDITEESTIKVEKINVKPENFIITTENDERFKCKGKAKVDNESFKVKNQKKDKIVDKSEKNKPSTSTNSTSGTSTSTCSPSTACSTNVPVHRPSVYIPPPKRFEGTHWNKSFVEWRSCFRCGQQGHIIRDCRLLSLDRFGREMPRTSSFRNSFSKSFSRRGSYSPVSSCASNSPKPMARVNKVVPSRPQVQKHNIVENKSTKSKQVWKPKSTNNTSTNSAEFLKYHKLVDVMIMDDFGQPKSIKAWVSHKI